MKAEVRRIKSHSSIYLFFFKYIFSEHNTLRIILYMYILIIKNICDIVLASFVESHEAVNPQCVYLMSIHLYLKHTIVSEILLSYAV